MEKKNLIGQVEIKYNRNSQVVYTNSTLNFTTGSKFKCKLEDTTDETIVKRVVEKDIASLFYKVSQVELSDPFTTEFTSEVVEKSTFRDGRTKTLKLNVYHEQIQSNK